jgi:hypothetical protein
MTLDALIAHFRYKLELPTSWNMIYLPLLDNLAIHISDFKTLLPERRQSQLTHVTNFY